LAAAEPAPLVAREPRRAPLLQDAPQTAANRSMAQDAGRPVLLPAAHLGLTGEEAHLRAVSPEACLELAGAEPVSREPPVRLPQVPQVARRLLVRPGLVAALRAAQKAGAQPPVAELRALTKVFAVRPGPAQLAAVAQQEERALAWAPPGPRASQMDWPSRVLDRKGSPGQAA
jgi:hypothetical protein